MNASENAKSQQVAIRMPHDLVARIDAWADARSQPGIPVSRAAAIKALCEMGLAASEKRKS